MPPTNETGSGITVGPDVNGDHFYVHPGDEYEDPEPPKSLSDELAEVLGSDEDPEDESDALGSGSSDSGDNGDSAGNGVADQTPPGDAPVDTPEGLDPTDPADTEGNPA